MLALGGILLFVGALLRFIGFHENAWYFGMARPANFAYDMVNISLVYKFCDSDHSG